MPKLLELFAGSCAVSKAFAKRGWTGMCVDLKRDIDPPAGFEVWITDVMQITDGWIKQHKFDFIWASPPCEQFSTLRNFRPPVPYPELGIKLFNHTRQLCEASGVPYVMENVAGAQAYVGRSFAHCGPYHLWGSGIPTILPQGITKGMTELAMGLREYKGKPGWDNRHGSIGITPAAKVATIPHELANCVADYATRILEVKHA